MSFTLSVKTLDARDFKFTVDSNLTVAQFKQHISEAVGIVPERQRLIFQGRVLHDEKKLLEFNLDNKVVHLVERAPPSETSRASSTEAATGSTASRQNGGRPDGQNVLVAAFAMPVDEFNSSQIEAAVRRVLNSLGETGRNSDVFVVAAPNSDSLEVRISLRSPRRVISSPAYDRLQHALRIVRHVRNLLVRVENESSSVPEETETVANSNDSGSNRHPELEDEVNVYEEFSTAQPDTANACPTGAAGVEPVGTDAVRHGTAADLADLMDEVLAIEDRIRPHIGRYQELLRDERDLNNSASERRQASRLFSRIQVILHNLSHIYHVISDLDLYFNEAPPRRLYPQIDEATTRQLAPETEVTIGIQTTSVPAAATGPTGGIANISRGSQPQFPQMGPLFVGPGGAGVGQRGFRAALSPRFGHGGEAVVRIPLSNWSGNGQVPGPLRDTMRQPDGQPGSGFMWAEVGPNSVSLNTVSVSAVTDRGQTRPTEASSLSAEQQRMRHNSAPGRNAPPTNTSAAGSDQSQNNQQPGSIQQLMQELASASGNLFGEAMQQMRRSASTHANLAAAATSSATSASSVPLSFSSSAASTSRNIAEVIARASMQPGTTHQILLQPVSVSAAVGSPLFISSGGMQQQGVQPQPTSGRIFHAPQQLPASSAASPPSAPSTAIGAVGPRLPQFQRTPVGIQFRSMPYNAGAPLQFLPGHVPPLFIGPTPPLELPLFTLDPYLTCSSHHFAAGARAQAGRPRATTGSSSLASTSTSTDEPSTSVATTSASENQQEGDVFMRQFEDVIRSILLRMIDQRHLPDSHDMNAPQRMMMFTPVVVGPQPPVRMVREFRRRTENVPVNAAAANVTRVNTTSAQPTPAPAATGAQPSGNNEQLVMNLIQGVAQSVIQGSSDTIETFLQRMGETIEPGEGILGELVTFLMRRLTFLDIIAMTNGNADNNLNALRPALRQFFSDRLLNGNSHPSRDDIRVAARHIATEREANVRRYVSDIAPREGVDIAGSLTSCEEHHIDELLQLLFSEPDENPNFGRRFYDRFMRSIDFLLSLCFYCCAEGRTGAERIIQRILDDSMFGIPQNLQTYMNDIGMTHVRSFMDRSTLSESDLERFVVRQQTTTQLDQSLQQQQMHLEESSVEFVDAQSDGHSDPTSDLPEVEPAADTTSAPVERDVDSSEEYMDADTTPRSGSTADEAWRVELPPDWVRVIEEDIIRQQRIPPQRPFSDAYLNSMPAKRRKLINEEKPQLMASSSDLFKQTLCEAIADANVSPVTGANSDDVVGVAQLDPVVVEAYEKQLQELIAKRIQNDPDFDQKKYPNAHDYSTK